MRYSQNIFAYVSTIALASAFALPAFSQATAPAAKSQAFGIVDRDKVVTSYPKAQQAAEELRKSEEKVHKLIEDSNKQYEEAKNAHKPPAELEGLQKRLQASIDDEVKRVQARAQSLESQLETDIDAAIKAEAAKSHVDVVMMKQAVLMGGVDLTEGVVKHLNIATAGTTKPTTK